MVTNGIMTKGPDEEANVKDSAGQDSGIADVNETMTATATATKQKNDDNDGNDHELATAAVESPSPPTAASPALLLPQQQQKYPPSTRIVDNANANNNNNSNSNSNSNNTGGNDNSGVDDSRGKEAVVDGAATATATAAELSLGSSEEESVADLGRASRDNDYVDSCEVEEAVEEGDSSGGNIVDNKNKNRSDKEGEQQQQYQQQHQQKSSLAPSSANLIQQQQKQRDNDNANNNSNSNSNSIIDANSAGICTHPSSPPPSSLPRPTHQQHFTHAPMSLPTFKEPRACMWTSSHAANAPSEDRSASLVNVLLQPLPHTNFDSEEETQIHDNFNDGEYRSLIRLNLWSVIDGHGGGCVATYASEVLLPHIAASISRAMGCAIVSRGVCLVNGQLRDANALDLDGLIKTTGSDRSQSNPNSIHYRSPYEATNTSNTDDSDKDDDDDDDHDVTKPKVVEVKQRKRQRQDQHQHQQQQQNENENEIHPHGGAPSPSVGVARDGAPAGTHSPQEQAAIIRAITQSFLSVDEGWINSIDPVATHQTSCQSNGRWNSGACALTVMSVQRLEWTSISSSSQRGNNDDDGECDAGGGLGAGDGDGGHDTSQNKDAARRRRIDHNENRALKSASSQSTISSTSSLTTTDAGLESEITETEGEEDDHNGRDGGDKPIKSRRRNNPHHCSDRNDGTNIPKESLISAPGGCSCHCYRAYDAMLYTAHVGDCRAVMLGSAPPTTINVRGSASSTKSSDVTAGTTSVGPGNQTDDESSHHSSDETEVLSSSDHDADSSDDDDIMMELEGRRQRRHHNHHLDGATAVTKSTVAAGNATGASAPYMTFMRGRQPARPRRQSRRRRYDDLGMAAPYIALPPLESFRSIEIEIDPDYDNNRRRHHHRRNHNSNSNNNDTINNGNGGGSGNNGDQSDASSSSSSSQDSREFPPAIILPPATHPIDLTTDHSAYNPAEVTAVLRRCNNAPRAISAGLGGGIKRVAGSLAVTRALGDAYLKTPRLSFFPYKTHAPYITARPEVNCRPIVKGGDKVLMLATDGVWERAGGEDVLRWARTFYSERLAEAERRKNIGRLNKMDNHHLHHHSSSDEGDMSVDNASNATATNNTMGDNESVDSQHGDRQPEIPLIDTAGAGTAAAAVATATTEANGNKKRDAPTPPLTANAAKRRKLTGRSTTRRATPFGSRRNSTVADVIVRRVLNKVRRARNISSLHALMSLPPGRARRSKHDDITACVVDLSAFVS